MQSERNLSFMKARNLSVLRWCENKTRTSAMLQTVHDLFRTEAALLITCRNCGHAGKVAPLLLRERFGLYHPLAALRWRCTARDGRNVRIGIGSVSLTEPPQRNSRSLSSL